MEPLPGGRLRALTSVTAEVRPRRPFLRVRVWCLKYLIRSIIFESELHLLLHAAENHLDLGAGSWCPSRH
jgi:hypothetical protein